MPPPPLWSDPGRLLVTEEREAGSVGWGVYLSYLLLMNPLASGLIAVLLCGGQAMYLASDWWLAMWSNAPDQGQPR